MLGKIDVGSLNSDPLYLDIYTKRVPKSWLQRFFVHEIYDTIYWHIFLQEIINSEYANNCNNFKSKLIVSDYLLINVIGDILAVEAEKENVSGNSGEDRENSSQKSNT